MDIDGREPCCAIFSEIRDILSVCQIRGGLNRQDALRLQADMDSHELPDTMEVLNKILSQLGLTWSECPEEDKS